MADQKLRIDILGNARGLNTSLKKASANLKSFGASVKGIGDSLKTRLTLPLALAGGAAIKAAVDFEKSMTQIKTLVGVAGDEVDAMAVKVKEMATSTGVSAKEAADALFFITSAGLRGADALDVLDQATKASAVGLGETATIADLATSALNAYGVENLNAQQATDILTGAVREGKLSADSLAQSMGAVLPFASQLGVGFDEVGAAFAAMSRTGTDAASAATQIKGILTALLKPSSQAQTQLEDLGLSASGLRAQMGEEGLLATLKTLTQSFGSNEEAAAKVFGNVRALAGVMDLMGAGLESTEQIFSSMNNTAGLTGEAFGKLANTQAFQLEKSLNELKSVFTDIGAVLLDAFLPVIKNVAGFIKGLSNAFKNLTPEAQGFAVAIGALVAGLPFLISAFGTIITVLGTMLSPLGLVAAALAGVAFVISKNWNEVLPVVVGLYNRFVDLFNSSKVLRIAIFGLRSAFKSAFVFAKAQIDQVVNTFSTMWRLIKEFAEKGFKGSFTDILSDGFDNAKDIAATAADNIAKTFTDGYEDALSSNLEYATVEGVQNGLSSATDAVKGYVKDFQKAIGLGDVSGGGAAAQAPTTTTDTAESTVGLSTAFDMSGIDAAFDPNSLDADLDFAADLELEEVGEQLDAFIEKQKKLQEISQIVGQQVAGAFDQMAGSLVDSLGLADSGFQGFLKGLATTVFQLMAMYLSQSISAAIAGATTSGAATGPAAIFTTPAFIATAVGGVLSAFAAIPKFAQGGIVSAPTLAMVGDNVGAKNGNPEVIAPLDKLQGMMASNPSNQNVNVGGSFKVQGQDLVVALQRANRNRDRL